jgi:hypothetical protein
MPGRRTALEPEPRELDEPLELGDPEDTDDPDRPELPLELPLEPDLGGAERTG